MGRRARSEKGKERLGKREAKEMEKNGSRQLGADGRSGSQGVGGRSSSRCRVERISAIQEVRGGEGRQEVKRCMGQWGRAPD